jgi:hypothetical protein
MGAHFAPAAPPGLAKKAKAKRRELKVPAEILGKLFHSGADAGR